VSAQEEKYVAWPTNATRIGRFGESRGYAAPRAMP